MSSTLAGIASVGSSSGHISQISCLSIGSIGGVIYLFGTYGMERLRLDDPLQSTQTHLLCGLWGVIALGLFDMEKGVITTGQFELITIQLIGAAAILFSSSILTIAYFRFSK